MKKSILITLSLLLVMSTAVMAASPVDVRRQSIDGCEYIIKVYELPPDGDTTALIEADFQQDGFSFAHHTTVSEEITSTNTRLVTETRAVETEGKDLAEVLKKYPSTLLYEKDGYTGTITLDTGSISTEVAGYTRSSRTISTTQTYPTLLYQDPSSVPQTAVKDGVTLPLTDVSWTVTGTSLAGDSLVPTEYTATATYSKKVTASVPTGYISTAIYSGEVSKTEVTAVRYTITYLGTEIPVPEPEAAPEPMVEAKAFPWHMLMIGAALLLTLGGGVAAGYFLGSRQEAERS